MSHFAVLCPHNAGHLLPTGTLGSELARRGHRVTIIGSAQSAPIAKQLGLPLVEMSGDGIEGPNAWLLWTLFNWFGAGWMIGLRTGYCRQAMILLERLPPILKELAVDGLIIDQTFSGGGTVAEHLGLPYVTSCSALSWNEDASIPPPFTHWNYAKGAVARWRNRTGYAVWRWYMRPVLSLVNRYRRKWNLRPLRRIDDEFSPLAQFCQLCPEMDFPRKAAPPTFHYVGPLAANRPTDKTPFPWDKLDGRPLIFASVGTVPDPANLPMFRKILAACHGVDAQLVLAMGKWTDHGEYSIRDQLGELPKNAIVVDFAPQMAILEKASLLITHAGINTVMEALSRGVPIVALPRNADQTGTGSRVAYSGAGLRAFFRTVAPDQLQRMIESVLTEDSFRRRAKEIQQSIVEAGGAPRAAEIAERALTTRQPVPRR
jgi:zeaxanthin glucosyltransferase